MPVEHYENFPVASLLLPRHLREPIEAIYAFARSADDIADEGDAAPLVRLAQLNDYRNELNTIDSGGMPTAPMFARLARSVRAHALPTILLRDLLDAFSQDVVKSRYADFAELREYSRLSADPVGRLLLHLYKRATPENLSRSDDICSALQYINFWQDVAIDWKKDRVYIPQSDLQSFGIKEKQIAEGRSDQHWRNLMHYQVDRARRILLRGAPLARALPGRIGWELRLVVQGGLRTLEKIEAVDYDVFRHRPTLGKTDWLRMLWRAAFMKA
ncbi:squalene synthase HpnC [Uliginosibacterium sp. H3]|uniref:Squalene synthase HpnC n=1 Tax=Uliginosibacterium silvisoli TaxID=3114758 RepID=A0ABU6K5F8_9RHOO|nr:squalene synthase HpnC [Uliginosibacterium sp. H3]